MIENLTNDRYCSEFFDGKFLWISCGTPDRLTKERLEGRIKDAFEKAGDEVSEVEIKDGFESIKKQYTEKESAAEALLVALDGVERYIPVKLFVKEIIFDHDLGSDTDDGGAAAILIKAHRDGYVKALAITSCVFNSFASCCIKSICEYFGVDDIEIGVNTERDSHKSDAWWRCSYIPVQLYYVQKGREIPTFETNTKLIRRKLAESHGDVTFLSTGALPDLLALFQTEGDEYSPLSGVELFKQNVGHYVCGGCKFPEGSRESNFLCDPEACDLVINQYLKGFPISFVGAEVAGIVFSGSVMKQEKYENYILRQIYETWRPDDCNHNSWDLGVMHYSIFGVSSGFFTVNKGYTVEPYGTNGEAHVTEGGCHEYIVRLADPQTLSNVFNWWIVP